MMGSVIQIRDPIEGTRNADFVYTDVWTSMGQEAETAKRLKDFQGYQVNPELMELARPQARFMHDMPAHPGEEVSEDMLSHPSSVVYQQAENRMWAQMALMERIVGSSHPNPFLKGEGKCMASPKGRGEILCKRERGNGTGILPLSCGHFLRERGKLKRFDDNDVATCNRHSRTTKRREVDVVQPHRG